MLRNLARGPLRRVTVGAIARPNRTGELTFGARRMALYSSTNNDSLRGRASVTSRAMFSGRSEKSQLTAMASWATGNREKSTATAQAEEVRASVKPVMRMTAAFQVPCQLYRGDPVLHSLIHQCRPFRKGCQISTTWLVDF